MNIDQMAHEYVLQMLKNVHENHGYLGELEIENLTETAYAIADAMQAESLKRQGGVPDAILEAERNSTQCKHDWVILGTKICRLCGTQWKERNNESE